MSDVTPTVIIFLSTFQGENFLQEQLLSIERQSYKNWVLIASDDGSTDHTLSLLEKFQIRVGQERVKIRSGGRKGYVHNFLSSACDSSLEADFYAFSDQDDIWEEDKLSRALNKLQTLNTQPAVYCSPTRLIDREGKEIGFSPYFTKVPCFANALIQNIAGGNTMIFNEAARKLLIQAGGAVDVPAHDWWLYLVVTACGGQIIYDAYPTVRYRQHNANLIGSNMGWFARFKRARLLFKGRFREWSDKHIKALTPIYAYLTPTNRKIFDTFCQARSSWLIPRVWGIHCSGVYRQTRMGNMGLVLAALFNKI